MSEAPEDRGPSSLRIAKYNPSNPIHEGLVARQHPNFGAPVNAHIDARADHIVMPVAKGMETEPKLSGRHMTNEEHADYVVPAKNRIKLPKPKPIIKTDAPSMETPKDVGAIWKKVGRGSTNKKLSKDELVAQSNARAAKIKAKREGKA